MLYQSLLYDLGLVFTLSFPSYNLLPRLINLISGMSKGLIPGVDSVLEEDNKKKNWIKVCKRGYYIRLQQKKNKEVEEEI